MLISKREKWGEKGKAADTEERGVYYNGEEGRYFNR